MQKAPIEHIEALQIFDSRGNPTLKVTVWADGKAGRAAVPSGASTGDKEALELRDNDPKHFFGKGVQKAIHNVVNPLASALKGKNALDQRAIDESMIKLDGTPDKSNLGANALLGISMATAKVAAKVANRPLYSYLGDAESTVLPCPMMNIINGGVHADNGLEYQEFMIRPVGAPTFSEAVRFGAEIFHTLKGILKKAQQSTSVGDEGGFAPRLDSNEQALELLMEAIEKAGYQPGKEITLALDCAASEFYKEGNYGKKTVDEHVATLKRLCETYPIDSIEDGMDQNDWEGWKKLTATLGDKVQIVGDDLFVTNSVYLQKGIDENVANAILIKLNQIGTVSETIDCVNLAKSQGYKTIFSHRSGETEDTFLADITVALKAGQIKTGSLCRSERTAKYNRLLEIEKALKNPSYAG